MFSDCMKTYTHSLPTKQHIEVCILCDQYILLILYTGSNLLNLVDFFLQSRVIVKGGSGLSEKVVNYYSRSLFDLGCPVNQGQVLTWTFDGPEHLQTFTEQAGTEKFGVFFVDYLYVLQPFEDASQMMGKIKLSTHVNMYVSAELNVK